MRLTNISTRYLPKFADGIITCFVNEPFKLLTNRSYTADLGFSFSDILPRTRILAWRNDDILVYNVNLPSINILNMGEDRYFEKGDILAYLGVTLLFTVHFSTLF